MKISKSLDIDLNIISPQKHIRIHEGDVDSVDILIGVSVDDESVALDGLTIKYDATINNYLAEQDADGSVVDGKISIPVTQNMTAMSGLLLVDVRMIRNDKILHTQTIWATVEKAVVNGSTYIDLDKITIIQRMNALEKQMEHVEEIIKDFDTSKLIVSTNLPPMSVPSEVDVDLLREGDTWIQRGTNIVYKLTEAQYNYQDDPSVELYHKFTWQPLNERYVTGNAEPPTTATYDRVSYDIETWHFSGLPVPEYFKGDQYSQMVDSDPEKHFTLNSAQISLISFHTVVYHYDWREEGGSGDLSAKMDLAPLNPTSEQIAAMPSGQIYDDTTAKTVTIKGGTELLGVIRSSINPEYGVRIGSLGQLLYYGQSFYICNGNKWILLPFADSNVIRARWTTTSASGKYIITSSVTLQEVWELFDKYHFVKVAITNQYHQKIGVTCLITRVTGNNHEHLSAVMLPTGTGSSYPIDERVHFLEQHAEGSSDTLRLETKYVYPPYEEYYTKAEIDAKIGDIGTALDTLNNNLAEV